MLVMKLKKSLPLSDFFPLSEASGNVSSFLIGFPEDYKYTPALKLNQHNFIHKYKKMQKSIQGCNMFAENILGVVF